MYLWQAIIMSVGAFQFMSACAAGLLC
eukprot:SAG25_NODE_7924_length_450_cov_0.584046_1_plen_26_part_01